MNNRTTLRVLLVLSMIGSGLNLISYLMIALMQPQFRAVLESNPALFPAEMGVMMEQMLDVPRLFYAACAVLYALSLTGVVLMWNLRFSGFHCYTLAQLLLLVVPVLFLGREYLNIGDIMFTLLFVAAYYFLMRSLRPDDDNAAPALASAPAPTDPPAEDTAPTDDPETETL